MIDCGLCLLHIRTVGVRFCYSGSAFMRVFYLNCSGVLNA
ncbi:hypothetical protein MuYL_4354 [Mucilaginibacter xinganensis]|uniref:Uncharacterized protein n=1 Tax=Mucilaginibacter xinganensis TaxID=1234841 RepID=A0A223P257_9SPHI|nr:hypothetical protein MuYL_4354 [Mucilaginibacter xinganensis]